METTKGGILIPQTADGVERLNPPPTYDQVMMPSRPPDRTGPAATSGRLTYIDVMPRCTYVGNWELKQPPVFDTFSEVVRMADGWLQTHPAYLVWKCETIERRVNKGSRQELGIQYDFEAMLRLESLYGFMIHVRGLRLWLTERPPATPYQPLVSFDVIPDVTVAKVPTDLNVQDTFFVVDGHVINYQPELMTKEFRTYMGLHATVDKLNNMLKTTPLAGTILNIEAVTIKRNYHDSVARDLDSNQSSWDIDGGAQEQRSTRILRVYYTSGAPAHETIGIQLVVPAVTKLPSWMGRPTFQRQSEMAYAVSHWLNQSQGVRLLGVQQYDVRFYWKGEKVCVASDSMDHTSPHNDASVEDLLKTQLLFYTMSSSAQAQTPPTVLASRLFTPIRIGRRSYETMQQTAARIDSWLRATGLNVYKLETVELQYVDNDEQGVNTETSSYCLHPLSGHQWVTCVRLYFPQNFQEPCPYSLPLPLDWKSQANSSGTCCVL